MNRLHPIMLGGTGSDVGKSLIATGLCRIFLQDGYNPAPFKAQNMALNSFATPDGGEIGRAQAVQAEACGLPCHTDMNPLLLKPSGNHTSQVVLNGHPIGNRDAYTYFRNEGRDWLRSQVHEAFDRLASRFNPIVMEGAGSIAEINLADTDLVNMSMAEYAGARVILVADIDRGGVFASAYGSIMLQPPHLRKLIRGIIVNKFRGDMRLFERGRKMMEEVCGVPVFGVVPFAPDIHIEAEDSVVLDSKNRRLNNAKTNIAIVRLPHISNFTDFDRLDRDDRVNLLFTDSPEVIRQSDIIILPGTKATIPDMQWLRDTDIADAIVAAAHSGKTVIGICGGYQMMGREVLDPSHIESSIERIAGLNLLPASTTLAEEKVTRQTSFILPDRKAAPCSGYEIHQGRTAVGSEAAPMVMITETDGTIRAEGCRAGNCMGCYIHGLFDNNIIADYLLGSHSDTADYRSFKEQQYDALAAHLRTYIDIPQLYKIMSTDD